MLNDYKKDSQRNEELHSMVEKTDLKYIREKPSIDEICYTDYRSDFNKAKCKGAGNYENDTSRSKGHNSI